MLLHAIPMYAAMAGENSCCKLLDMRVKTARCHSSAAAAHFTLQPSCMHQLVCCALCPSACQPSDPLCTLSLPTAALQLCVNLGCIYVIRRNWSWANSQPGSEQGPAVRTGSGDAGSTGLKALPDGEASQKDASDVLPAALGGTMPLT